MKITKLENYNYENLEYFNSYASKNLQRQIIEFKNFTERKQKYKKPAVVIAIGVSIIYLNFTSLKF